MFTLANTRFNPGGLARKISLGVVTAAGIWLAQIVRLRLKVRVVLLASLFWSTW